MITVRPAGKSGQADHGWLESWHTFSFADYHDPRHMGFRSLRVINDDRVEPARGFGTHQHRDMEIVTIVLEGALEHKDSMGTGSVIRSGDVQRMSAGTGVSHSEMNPSKTEPVHFYQIWILPEAKGQPPSYEQKQFSVEERQNQLRLIASRDGRDGSITVHQDAALYMGVLDVGAKVGHAIAAGRSAWVQVARGAVTMNGKALVEGDGAAVTEEAALAFEASERAEVIVFDLA
jgi:quercetin 2,3-dioxygenase